MEATWSSKIVLIYGILWTEMRDLFREMVLKIETNLRYDSDRMLEILWILCGPIRFVGRRHLASRVKSILVWEERGIISRYWYCSWSIRDTREVISRNEMRAIKIYYIPLWRIAIHRIFKHLLIMTVCKNGPLMATKLAFRRETFRTRENLGSTNEILDHGSCTSIVVRTVGGDRHVVTHIPSAGFPGRHK